MLPSRCYTLLVDKKTRESRIQEIEEAIAAPGFWARPKEAQALIKELQSLKTENAGGGPYDGGDAVLTIFAGAGGDDAEDFARMLVGMYERYVGGRNWGFKILHQNQNSRGGFRNFTAEISGKSSYGILKGESGVHRLVRLSPFNANQLRHTSFAMVEIIPKFEKSGIIDIPPEELSVDFARSSGPGGQNVNKRETSVRMVHLPTKLAVHVESERSQAQNREKALQLLSGKIYKLREEERLSKEKGMYISKTTDAAWGNQIRSYVLHPYKLVKDHRTGVEMRNPEAVLGGDIQDFLDAEIQAGENLISGKTDDESDE